MTQSYKNPWLALARRRRLQNELRSMFMGKKYRECAKELTQYAYNHQDWQPNFVIYSSVDVGDLIDSLEVQESV
jgi:hypothetical protein